MNGCLASVCASSSHRVPVAPAASVSPACPSKKTTAASCRRRRRSVSCRASSGGGDDDGGLLWLPRREVLSGLTGVAAGLAGYPGFASAAVDAELEVQCRKGEKVTEKLVECTDPYGKIPCPPPLRIPVVDFKPEKSVRRVRQAAHLLSAENQEKYKEAVAKMKALPADNPLSFAEQAAIHEAYCDGHYRYDPTEKNRPFDVHFSWIFAPWHRMYIYFYERALGQLIGDDTFALPYWNWDTPAGMVVPPLFLGSLGNPLYDPNRNTANLDKVVDLTGSSKLGLIDFYGDKDDAKYQEAVKDNLTTVYQQQIRAGKGARNFLGEKFCTKTGFRQDEINARSKRRQGAGNQIKVDKTKSQGTLERMAHTTVHIWVGKKPPSTCTPASGVVGHDGKPHCRNDMGFLGSAGRDPLFYSHHANVDRLWHIWSTKLDGKGFSDPEWLDASFVFYDGVDNPQRVRVKFRDVLDAANLGYTYDGLSDEDLPWLKCKLASLVPRGKGSAPRPSPTSTLSYPVPLKLGEVVEVPAVKLPAAQRGKQRLLVIDGVVYDPADNNKFDVAINVPKDKADKVGPSCTEYAGSFSIVPSSKEGGGSLEGKVTFSIEEVLADIGALADSSVDVVFVPRTDTDIKLSIPPYIESVDQD